MNKNKHDFSPFYIAMASVAFFCGGYACFGFYWPMGTECIRP